MASTKQLYRHFKENHQHPVCWACGRDESQRPDGWYGPFVVERAHLVSSPRAEDVRLIVLLDTICHKVSGGERIFINGQLWPLPKLTLPQLLTLKELFDPEHYDRAFMQRFSAKRLPEPEPIPDCYIAAYRARRHGV